MTASVVIALLVLLPAIAHADATAGARKAQLCVVCLRELSSAGDREHLAHFVAQLD